MKQIYFKKLDQEIKPFNEKMKNKEICQWVVKQFGLKEPLSIKWLQSTTSKIQPLNQGIIKCFKKNTNQVCVN